MYYTSKPECAIPDDKVSKQHVCVHESQTSTYPDIKLLTFIEELQCASGAFSASGASVCTACTAGKYLTLASGGTEAGSCTGVSFMATCGLLLIRLFAITLLTICVHVQCNAGSYSPSSSTSCTSVSDPALVWICSKSLQQKFMPPVQYTHDLYQCTKSKASVNKGYSPSLSHMTANAH